MAQRKLGVRAARAEAQEFLGTRLPAEFPEGELQLLDRSCIEILVAERGPHLRLSRAALVAPDAIWAVASISVESCAGHFERRPVIHLAQMCECAMQAALLVTAANVNYETVAPILVGTGDSRALAKTLLEPPLTLLVHAQKIREKLGVMFVVNSKIFANASLAARLDRVNFVLLPKSELGVSINRAEARQ